MNSVFFVKRLILGALLAACLLTQSVGAGEAGKFPCAASDQKCALETALKHPIRFEPFWKEALGNSLEMRIGAAPDALIEFIALDNIAQGIPEKPRAPDLSPAFVKDVRDAFDDLPTRVKELLAPKLAGIYFIEGLGGTGYTSSILTTDSKKEIAGFIILDASVLRAQTANSWATWKESTPFISHPAFALTAQIEDVGADNRKNAIQYILLHEIGHVLSIGSNIHPSWTLPPNTIPDAASFPFFEQSWQIDKAKNRYVSRFDAGFTRRQDVVYYFGPLLYADRMLSTYTQLENTNFPTLYAATRPGDDFAESFVSYVHTIVMNRPFSIKLYQDGFLMKDFRICWEEPRCAAKRKILEQMLAEK